jgi:hypothetical protein
MVARARPARPSGVLNGVNRSNKRCCPIDNAKFFEHLKHARDAELKGEFVVRSVVYHQGGGEGRLVEAAHTTPRRVPRPSSRLTSASGSPTPTKAPSGRAPIRVDGHAP